MSSLATRRGRPAEIDTSSLHFQIASFVYQTMKTGGQSLKGARRDVAEHLGISVDTVRRAWRKHGTSDIAAGALIWQFELIEKPAQYRARQRNLKMRLAEIRRSRGK